jgi:flagellar biosynthesis protein FlhA
MKRGRLGTVGVPAAVLFIVVMLVIPLPSQILDALITINMTFAVLVLIMSMRIQKPLDFAAFPSLLLVATMFRLSLNVSATRLVLLHGYAGTVIQSFGSFVVGGSVLVGLVVFLILIVIQFVVITNGAGRVAEVAARFTLDALPGKQMAIDADLNSGVINDVEARRRRREVHDEADFYGAMDGASKFIKGDAIASVVITVVNLLGGFAVGIGEKHLSLSSALTHYSLLSVGDGLVSQIPALLLSVSTGLVVTRSATDEEFGSDLVSQIGKQAGSVRMAGAAVAILGLIPGLPTVPFLLIGGIVFVLGRRIIEVVAGPDPVAAEAAAAAATAAASDSPATLLNDSRIEAVQLELAVDLIDLVDPARGGDLLDRVKGLRRKIATDLGIVLPSVRTRDDLQLPAQTYCLRIHDVEVGRGRAPAGRVLAVGADLSALPGEATTEPVFGLPAKWIPKELREHAMVLGVTVVDRSAVITTHLAEVVRQHAGSLLSRQRVKEMLDNVRLTDPAAVDELTTAQVTLGELQNVLRNLLDEGVPIRDIVRIVEAVAARARLGRDVEAMTEAARASLGSAISASHVRDGVLPVLTLDPTVEQQLVDGIRAGEDGTVLTIDGRTAEALITQIVAATRQAEEHGRSPVLLVAGRIRPALRRMVRPAAPRLAVVSVNELSAGVKLERLGVVNDVLAPV